MKNYLMWILIFISGLVIGSWWPQSELSIARTKIEELQQKVASNTSKNFIPEMAKMIALPADAMPSRKPAKPKIQPTSKPDPIGKGIKISIDENELEELSDRENSPFDDEFAAEMERAFEGTDNPEDALNTMAELWKTRRNMAREALADNLGLSDSELDDFDLSMEDMNDKLALQFEEMMDSFADFESMEDPAPEDAFRLAHAFTGVFVDTYDNLDDTLPHGWREDTETPVDLTAFIDPYVFKPMLDFDQEWSAP